MAQSVKHPGHLVSGQVTRDLVVHEFKPRVGLCADSAEPASDSLSLSLSLSLSVSLTLLGSHALSLSLKINK